MREADNSGDFYSSIVEYQLPADPSTLQELLLERGDIPYQRATHSNGSGDESLLLERDLGRLRLTRLFEVRQRRRVGGRTVRGRITWKRDKHIRDGERFWDREEVPRAVLTSHSMINTLDGLEDGLPEGEPTALVDEDSINRDSRSPSLNRSSWTTFPLPYSARLALQPYSSRGSYSGA